MTDIELQRARLRAQVDIILRRLPGAATWPPGNTGTLDYLYRAERILVRDADLDRVRNVVGGVVADALIHGVTALTPGDGDAQAALATIDGQLGVGVATPDHVLFVTPAGCCPATEPVPVAQHDPDPEVRHDPGSDGTGALVSVVDSGYIAMLDNPQHSWLADVTGDAEAFDPQDLGPYTGHGTFIAGIVRCAAPKAEVRVEGFLTNGGAVYESEIVRQLNDALDLMPDVISLSAGTTTRGNSGLLSFQTWWENRLRHCSGTVLVAAAGNDASRRPFYPAAYDWAVSVGALDRRGDRATFSNFGSWVDVYALGVDMVNAFPKGTYKYKEPPNQGRSAFFADEMASWSGTSFSTPLVAGMIAARMSRTGQSGRHAADSVLRIARSHARPGVGPIADPSVIDDPDPAGVA
ncbi:MAG: S8 family peptidase [Jatrophihabitantaceae bacterium]